MPNFTENKTDRAYESFDENDVHLATGSMKSHPQLQRDPPEAKTIQKDIDSSQKQKGETLHEKSE